LIKGYLLSNAPVIRPTIDPPVKVPYQTTSASFLAFSIESVLCCALTMLSRVSQRTRAVAPVRVKDIFCLPSIEELLAHEKQTKLWLKVDA
jgi:hypothetical protein